MAASKMGLRILGLVLIAAAFAGCEGSEDREIDSKLDKVATHRTEHPHYPVIVFDDFGSASQPAGLSVDAYSFYVHETTKPNTYLNVLTPSNAAVKLEQTFERCLKSISAAEAAASPPKPPLPVNEDWKRAPHPKSGTYTIVCKLGPWAQSFDIPMSTGAPGDLDKTISLLRPELLQNANTVVGEALKMQNEALKRMDTPSGFSLCTEELLKIQQGNRGVEPHLLGAQLYLAPIDKALALKGANRSIRKLLVSTANLKPPSDSAHLVVVGPDFSHTYEIPLDGGLGEATAINLALEGIGGKIDELNKK